MSKIRKKAPQGIEHNPLPDTMLKRMRPAREVLPDLAATAAKRGRPKLSNPKQPVKLRIDADVIAAYRASGAGWTTRINNILRRAAPKLSRVSGKTKRKAS